MLPLGMDSLAPQIGQAFDSVGSHVQVDGEFGLSQSFASETDITFAVID